MVQPLCTPPPKKKQFVSQGALGRGLLLVFSWSALYVFSGYFFHFAREAKTNLSVTQQLVVALRRWLMMDVWGLSRAEPKHFEIQELTGQPEPKSGCSIWAKI